MHACFEHPLLPRGAWIFEEFPSIDFYFPGPVPNVQSTVLDKTDVQSFLGLSERVRIFPLILQKKLNCCNHQLITCHIVGFCLSAFAYLHSKSSHNFLHQKILPLGQRGVSVRYLTTDNCGEIFARICSKRGSEAPSQHWTKIALSISRPLSFNRQKYSTPHQ
jgi:hypothetical protein